jgi:chemotaxis protein MotA
MFFAGWENIRSQRKTMKTLAAEFTDKFLPQGNLLYFKDIEALHKNVATKTDNILGKLLRSTTSKLLIDRSTTNSIPLMESQLANVKNHLENQDTKLGFYVWAIPTIGFIGTVYGIATALGVADSAEISTITQYLGVAFDTTLLSLLLSVIITRTYHDLLASKEEYLNQLRGFVLENIISKTILNR